MTEDELRRLYAERILPNVDPAYRLARWLARSPTDAEDIVQDAALRAFRSLPDLRASDGRAWFLAIVRRCAFTFLARNRPNELVQWDAAEAPEAAAAARGDAFGAAPPATPEAEVLAAEQSVRFETAVDGLPLPFRAVLVLREIDGFSYAEIATILDIPIGTVMSRLARARAVLMDAFAEDRT